MLKRLLPQLAWWGYMPLGYALIWAFLHFVIGGIATWSQGWDQFFMAQFWSGGPLLWIWFLVGCIGSAIIWGASASSDDGINVGDKVIIAAASIAAVACVVGMISTMWDNDKNYGRYYNAATVFHVPSTSNPPASVSRLLRGAKIGDGPCQLRGGADVPSCIEVGTLPSAGWVPRIGSADGAVIALSRGDSGRDALRSSQQRRLRDRRGRRGSGHGPLDCRAGHP